MVLLFFVLTSNLVFSQEKDEWTEKIESRISENPDSVKTVLELQLSSSKIPKKRAAYHHLLASTFLVLNDFDKVFFHLNAEDSLLKVLPKNYLLSCDNQMAIADAYYSKGDLPKAESHYQSALEISLNIDDYLIKSDVLLSCGWIAREQGKHALALDYYFQAMALAEQNRDDDLLANCYGKIAIVYNVKGDLVKAEENYYKALEYRLKNKEFAAVASLYNNIGLMHDYAKNYDTAIYFFEKSMALYDSLGDARGVAIANENIGVMYYQKRENLPLALSKLKLSLDYWRSKKDVFGQCQTLVYIAYVYNEQGNFKAALDSAKRSMNFAIEAGARDVERDALLHISIALEGLSKYQDAFVFYKKHISLRDSLATINTSEQIDLLAMEHEFSSKQFEDSLSLVLQYEKEQAGIRVEAESSKFWNKLYLFGLAGLFIIVILIALINRQQKKSAALVAKTNILLQVKNKEITDSITYAKRIQNAILPSDNSIQSVFPKSFVYYQPKDIVAGDFYWLAESGDKDEKTAYYAVADCTGHGVPGAMVSVICSTALNKVVNEMQIKDPGSILNKVTDAIIETFEKSDNELKDGMDIALCCFNLTTNELQYSGANNSVWIVSKRKALNLETKIVPLPDNSLYLHEIKATKQPVGQYTKRIPFETHKVQLEQDDLVYLFTDGYADQFGGTKNKKFKYATLKTLLLSVAKLNVEAQREELKTTFDSWRGGLEQVDDVCLVGVKI